MLKPIIFCKGTGFNPKLITMTNGKNIYTHIKVLFISTKLSRITIPECVFVTRLIFIFIMFQGVDVAPKARWRSLSTSVISCGSFTYQALIILRCGWVWTYMSEAINWQHSTKNKLTWHMNISAWPTQNLQGVQKR